MQGFLTENVKITKVKDPTTDGTSAAEGASVDMAADGGFDGVVFMTSVSTAAANNTLKAQQSSDDGASDGFSDIEESAVDVGASDEDLVLDIQQPQKRYVKPVVVRGTSTVLGDIWAIQYRGRRLPTSFAAAGTLALKQLYRPDEGTA